MKIVKNVTYWLCILCLPALLLTTSVRILSGSAEFYRFGFNRHNVNETTGLPRAELDKVITGMLDYFRSGEEPINLTVTKEGQTFQLFNEREVEHLRDVKGLFRLNFRVLLGAFFYVLIYFGLASILWRDRRRSALALLYGSGLTLALLAALGLMIWINFDWFFYQFHLLSFANDLWMLDPATDYLIMLFPQGFWYDASLFCALGTALLALIVGLAGWWRLRKDKAAEEVKVEE